jgi:uncharacterized protein (TIGR03437 family)
LRSTLRDLFTWAAPPARPTFRSRRARTSAPGIFSLNASGEGSGAIFNQDGTVNTPDRRAAPGDVIVLYATGAGQTAPAGEDGKVNPPVLPCRRRSAP